MAENRLSRWSRLKSKGGAEPREEAADAEERTRTAVAEAEADPEFAKLPGGVQARHFVPAMPPLAPDASDDDDAYVAPVADEDAAPAEEAESEADEDEIFAGIDDEEMTDEQREAVAGLPPLESIGADSDLSPFMREDVPEFLKRKALRMLWRKDPFFNIRDGLNDYDEDFNIVHKIIDELTGHYKVGRGHLSEEELKEMTPDEARKTFYPDEDDEDDEDADAGAEDNADGENLAETTENDESDEAGDDEEAVGDGDDDTLA